jgi:hypothetical protein
MIRIECGIGHSGGRASGTMTGMINLGLNITCVCRFMVELIASSSPVWRSA